MSAPVTDNAPLEATTTEEKSHDRSVSRGREAFHSSGRGGLGNIRRSSQSNSRPRDGPDDFSRTRGREPAVNFGTASNVISTGRGGAGNMRSPSRDAGGPGRDDSREHDILLHHIEQEKTAAHSTGRGGLGNISRSQSRGPASSLSPTPPQAVHSSGRGGVGNITTGSTADAAAIEEEERRQHAHPEAHHSSGRGGIANISSSPSPAIENTAHSHPHHTFESTGRGGAGNIRDRSRSIDPEARVPDGEHATSDHKEKHGIAGLWNKVTHPGGASKHATPPQTASPQ